MNTSDTTSVCLRNTFSGVTFYDPSCFILKGKESTLESFPFVFIEKNQQLKTETGIRLAKKLKDGETLPSVPFHTDWVFIILFASAFLYSILRAFSKRSIPDLPRFFFFRGIGDPASRDAGELFDWQSTLFNLATFLNIALFVYYAAISYELITGTISGIIFWIISSGVIIVSITLRHIICFIMGRISESGEAFDEYMKFVYLAYRYSGIVLFIIVVLISFTSIFSVRFLINTGIFTFSLFYLIRIIRLFLIFMHRNLSVLYFILYLCALEFLPVVISVKYFTGLF